MSRTFARFASTPIGPALVAADGGLTVTANAVAASLDRAARSDIGHADGAHGAEIMIWGDDPLQATVGIITDSTPLDGECGHMAGIGYRPHTGEILMNGTIVASDLPRVSKGEIIGVRIDIGAPSVVSFYSGGTLIDSRSVVLVGRVHFAVSLATVQPGGLHGVVNAGQWQGVSDAINNGAGWASSDGEQPALRLASEDYISARSDNPANASYLGIIDADGLDTVASVTFWPWANESRTGLGQIRVKDADGLLDPLALNSARNIAVALHQVDQGDALSAATPIGRYVLDRVDIDNDSEKTVVLRDAHDDLDGSLHRAVFLPSISDALAWQPQPVIIGAVRSVPMTTVNSDGSIQWLCDVPIESVERVLDRGAEIAAGTGYALVDGQQLVFTSPPLGPVIADVSSIGPAMRPAKLTDALIDIFSRIDKSAWETAGYGTPFGMDQYQALAKAMAGLKGRALLTINDHPDMRRVFAGFRIKRLQTRYSVGRSAASKATVRGGLAPPLRTDQMA
jgi:hypothetical protein